MEHPKENCFGKIPKQFLHSTLLLFQPRSFFQSGGFVGLFPGDFDVIATYGYMRNYCH